MEPLWGPTEERFRELEEDVYSTWEPDWWNESRRITSLRGLTDRHAEETQQQGSVFGTKRLPERIKRDRSPRWDAICPALSVSLNGCHCKSWNCFMTIRWTLDLTSAVYDFQLLWKLWAVPHTRVFPTERAQRSTTEENTKIWNDCSIWSTAIAMWLLRCSEQLCYVVAKVFQAVFRMLCIC